MSLERSRCTNLLITSSNCFMSVMFIVEFDDDGEAWLFHICIYLRVVILYVGNFQYIGLMEY
jgi:hypothetical protein